MVSMIGERESRVRGRTVKAKAPAGTHVLWSRALGTPSAPLVIRLVRCPKGPLEVPAAPATRVSICLGPSVRLWCRADGRLNQGREVPGDMLVTHRTR